MGTEANGKDGQAIIRSVGGGESKSAKNPRKGSTGRTAGRTTGRTAGKAEEEKPLGLSAVEESDEEKKKREERNAKRRARYAEKKANKPKKVNNSKGKQAGVDQTQVEAVIMTLSSIVAKNPKTVYWQLSEAEVTQLATPLTNIMSKSDALTSMSEHSDAFALVTACFTILVPRAIMTMQMLPKKEKGVKHVKRDQKGTVPKSGHDEARETTLDTGNGKREYANGNQDNDTEQPYIGAPISY